MIQSKKDLKEYIRLDNGLHWNKCKNRIMLFMTHDEFYYINKYFRYLRKQEYYYNNIKRFKLYIIPYIFYTAKKNRIGDRANLIIPENTLEKGVTIFHKNVLVHPKARIGEFSVLHGNNCIGNNGITDEAPYLSNNVNIGYGACLIGEIYLAQGVYVGANAVVNKSFSEEGVTLIGVPAKHVK